MACKFPGANNLDDYWKNLKNGVSSIVDIPSERWDIDKYYSPTLQEGKSTSKWGGFTDGIVEIDKEKLGLKEDDISNMDPSQLLLLSMSYEAILHAGYDIKELSGKKVGVYVGSEPSIISNVANQYKKNTIPLMSHNFMAARISDTYNFKGPSLVVNTACSSALSAIHLAGQALKAGDIEYAIVGGVSFLTDEKLYLVLSQSNALSPDGKCHTFDEKANGFVPGEGCGVILLKGLKESIDNGDNVYAEIGSTAINNDGKTMGITTPSMHGQEDVIEEALLKGKIDATDISYIETHGTGTLIGDPIELKALTRVFSKYTDMKNYCAVGSVKSNVGHLLSAAGIASVIKVVLMMQNKQIVPTINCEKPNPRFEFAKSPFYPNTELIDWTPINNQRISGISSFGFGGTNAHIVVEEFVENSEIKRNPIKNNAESLGKYSLINFNGNKSAKSIDIMVEKSKKKEKMPILIMEKIINE